MTAPELTAPWSAHIAAVAGTYNPPLRGLYVAVSGNADITDLAGTTLTTVALTAGSTWPGQVVTLANVTATLYSGR